MCPRFLQAGHTWVTESAPRLPSKMLVREMTSILLLCGRTQTWRLCRPEIAEHKLTSQNVKMCGVTVYCLIISLLNCLQAVCLQTCGYCGANWNGLTTKCAKCLGLTGFRHRQLSPNATGKLCS